MGKDLQYSKFYIVVLYVTIMFPVLCFAQDLKMPSIFADQMILQRDMKVPVWGVSNPNSSILVEFLDQRTKTKSDEFGNWMVYLDPLIASSESEIMTISAQLNGKENQIQIKDVLVGEVWFAGGQSNMYRPFRMLTYPAREPKYETIGEFLRAERDNAHDPLLRQFRVSKNFSVLEEKKEGNGHWTKAVGKDVNEICATAYFFSKELRRELNVPVAVISCNLGGTKIEPWMSMDSYNKNETLRDFYKTEISTYNKNIESWDDAQEENKYQVEVKEWEQKVEKAKAEGKGEPRKPRKKEHPNRDKQVASTLYNAMIHPIIPYAVKGAIWYQGESNTGNFPDQYGMRLSSLIEGWREAWGQKDFYFYACQLANYKEANKKPVGDEDTWALLSYKMQEILELPDTGMAVLNDIGEAKDIHPKNKLDVGKRLSFWALNQAYGKDVVVSGPLYKSSKVVKNKIVIKFSHVGSGLMVGRKELMNSTIAIDEPLRRFQICDKSGVWKWAKAKIIKKDSIEVWHDEISKPVEVRYAWSSNPEGANLYNKEGLPASIFKTANTK